MNERINKLKEEIEEKHPDLFKKFEINNVTDDEIIEKELIIINFLSQNPGKKDFFYSLDVDKNGKIIEFFNSKFSEKTYINKVKENYLIKLDNDSFYFLDYKKHVNWTKEREQLKYVIMLINSRKVSGYWLKGKNGIGKTYMSISLLNKMAFDGLKVAYLFVPDFVRFFSSNAEEYLSNNKKIQYAKEADALLLDDIGSEKVSEWFRNNVLFSILNYREQNKKITLFTSNNSINEYSKILLNKPSDKLIVEKITDRIKSLTLEVEINDLNYRQVDYLKRINKINEI